MNSTWRCPCCWNRWPIEQDCPNCGPDQPIGLFRHPPVDPDTGEVSAADNAILMGDMQHCDVPQLFRREDCVAVMNDHGWLDDGTPHGVTVCPPPETGLD